MAILNILFLLLYFFFFCGELFRISVFSAVTVNPIDITVAVIATYWVFRIKKKKNYFLLKPILIFVLLALLSLIININNFNNSQILVSSLYLVRWLLYASLYFVVRDIGRDMNKYFVNFSTVTGGLLIVVGLLQLVFFPNLIGLYNFGWDKHLNRIFSTFLDPNFAGIVFVLFFIFVFTLKEKIFKSNKRISFIVLAITFLGIVLTYSRGAYLMFLSSSLFYSVIKKQKKIILSAVGIFAVVFIILMPGFYLENTNLLRTNSTLERIGTSIKALQIFKENPMGVGFNTYRYAREKYGEKDLSLAGPSHSGAGVDNSFIFVLVTSGFLGLISYSYLVFKIFKLGFKKINNGFGLVLIVSFAGLIMNSLTINSLFYSFVMMWTWILIGLTESN